MPGPSPPAARGCGFCDVHLTRARFLFPQSVRSHGRARGGAHVCRTTSQASELEFTSRPFGPPRFISPAGVEAPVRAPGSDPQTRGRASPVEIPATTMAVIDVAGAVPLGQGRYLHFLSSPARGVCSKPTFYSFLESWKNFSLSWNSAPLQADGPIHPVQRTAPGFQHRLSECPPRAPGLRVSLGPGQVADQPPPAGRAPQLPDSMLFCTCLSLIPLGCPVPVCGWSSIRVDV